MASSFTWLLPTKRNVADLMTTGWGSASAAKNESTGVVYEQLRAPDHRSRVRRQTAVFAAVVTVLGVLGLVVLVLLMAAAASSGQGADIGGWQLLLIVAGVGVCLLVLAVIGVLIWRNRHRLGID